MYIETGCLIGLSLIIVVLWYTHISKKNEEISKLGNQVRELEKKQQEICDDYRFREEKSKIKLIMLMGNIDEETAVNVYEQLKKSHDDGEFFIFYNAKQMKTKIKELLKNKKDTT